MLDKDCSRALTILKNVRSAVETWANLGLFFAEKIRAAVALQTYRTTGSDDFKEHAVTSLKSALHYWNRIIEITEPLYKDYPLVQYSEQDGKSWKENDHLR